MCSAYTAAAQPPLATECGPATCGPARLPELRSSIITRPAHKVDCWVKQMRSNLQHAGLIWGCSSPGMAVCCLYRSPPYKFRQLTRGDVPSGMDFKLPFRALSAKNVNTEMPTDG